MLATFELSRCIIAFHHGNYIQLQVFGTLQRMSLIEFSVQLGLYDTEFTRTTTYDALLTSWLVGESAEEVWQRLSTTLTYEPRQTKATTLCSPAL